MFHSSNISEHNFSGWYKRVRLQIKIKKYICSRLSREREREGDAEVGAEHVNDDRAARVVDLIYLLIQLIN